MQNATGSGSSRISGISRERQLWGAGQCPSLRLMSIFGWLSAGRAEDLRREFRADGGFKATSRLAQTHGSQLCCYGDVQNESIWRVKSETAGLPAGRGKAGRGSPEFFLSYR